MSGQSNEELFLDAFVIFLDFDGPLFPSKVLSYAQNQEPLNQEPLKRIGVHPFYTYWKADPLMVFCLNKLAEKGAACVVSSSWADDRMHTKEQIKALFAENEIFMPFHEHWRTPRENKSRADQISDWARQHSPRDYRILDDVTSGKDLVDEAVLTLKNLDSRKIVWVDEDSGISDSQVKCLLAI